MEASCTIFWVFGMTRPGMEPIGDYIYHHANGPVNTHTHTHTHIYIYIYIKSFFLLFLPIYTSLYPHHSSGINDIITFLVKDGFGIKYPTNVDMQLNK